jgi:transposase-like protein
MQTSIISIKHLLSEEPCCETIRPLRWQEGATCPHCDSAEIVRRGFDGPERHWRRYACKPCGKRFDDRLGRRCPGA